MANAFYNNNLILCQLCRVASYTVLYMVSESNFLPTLHRKFINTALQLAFEGWWPAILIRGTISWWHISVVSWYWYKLYNRVCGYVNWPNARPITWKLVWLLAQVNTDLWGVRFSWYVLWHHSWLLRVFFHCPYAVYTLLDIRILYLFLFSYFTHWPRSQALPLAITLKGCCIRK